MTIQHAGVPSFRVRMSVSEGNPVIASIVPRIDRPVAWSFLFVLDKSRMCSHGRFLLSRSGRAGRCDLPHI